MVWGPLISAGASLIGGLFGGDEEEESPQFAQAPEYPESQGARQLLWQRLQQFGDDKNYGAISPDWADIWTRAREKVRQYYMGTATAPGAIDRVKASAARRGVSQSPSIDANIAALGAEEGGQLGQIASEQALQESMFTENARQDWLGRVGSLASQKPTTQSYQPEQQMGWGDAISGIGSAVGNYYNTKSYQDWISKLFNQNRMSSSLPGLEGLMG